MVNPARVLLTKGAHKNMAKAVQSTIADGEQARNRRENQQTNKETNKYLEVFIGKQLYGSVLCSHARELSLPSQIRSHPYGLLSLFKLTSLAARKVIWS